MKLRRLIIFLLLSFLLLLPASPPAQAYSGYFYVIPTSAPLRECAAPECDVLLTVYQGDKVVILERTTSGWSRVSLVDRTGIGWIRSDLLSFSPDLKGVALPTFYVNTSSLPLRDGPTPEFKVIATLGFNDAVEMLGVYSSGWAQVRVLQTNIMGWVDPKYLSHDPVSQRRPAQRRRAPARETAP